MARIVKKTTFVKRIEDFQLSDVDKTLAMWMVIVAGFPSPNCCISKALLDLLLTWRKNYFVCLDKAGFTSCASKPCEVNVLGWLQHAQSWEWPASIHLLQSDDKAFGGQSNSTHFMLKIISISISFLNMNNNSRAYVHNLEVFPWLNEFRVACLNCRGLAAFSTRERLVHLMKKHGVDFLCLQETKINLNATETHDGY